MTDNPTVRYYLDRQFEVLQRLDEGEVTVDLIDTALHYNRRISILLEQSESIFRPFLPKGYRPDTGPPYDPPTINKFILVWDGPKGDE